MVNRNDKYTFDQVKSIQKLKDHETGFSTKNDFSSVTEARSENDKTAVNSSPQMRNKSTGSKGRKPSTSNNQYDSMGEDKTDAAKIALN